MTDLMELLYDYTLTARFSCCLHTDAYRDTDIPYNRHLEALRRELPGDLRQTFEKYCEVESERRDLELAAMFQAAFSVARELD